MRTPFFKIVIPGGWASLEPYDRFLARVRATGIPGLTAPPEAGGGKPAAEAPPPAEAAPGAPAALPASPAAPASEPAAPKSY